MTCLALAVASLLASSSTIPPAETAPATHRAGRVIAGTEIVGDVEAALWRSVLDVLPARPARIVLLDVDALSTEARRKVRGLQAFVVAGDRTIFVGSKATTLRQAAIGDGFDRLVLASVIHHEMAHARGLDERAALREEQALWRGLVAAGRVDHGLGLTYVRRLDEEQRQLPLHDASHFAGTADAVRHTLASASP